MPPVYMPRPHTYALEVKTSSNERKQNFKNTLRSQCRKLQLPKKDERKRPLMVPTFPLPPNNPCTPHTS